MKLGLDGIITEALKELAASHGVYMAEIRSEDYEAREAQRRVASDRHHAAEKRVLDLALALFPPPACATPRRQPKPRKPSTAIVRAANDTNSGRSRPRRLPAPRLLPAPQIEITDVRTGKPVRP